LTRFKPFLKPCLHKELADYINGLKVMPVNVEISLTGLCNAKCDWCFYTDEKTRDSLRYLSVDKLLHELSDLEVKAVTWTGGGEPTMHKDFKDIAELTKYLGLKQGLITNGLKKVDYDPTLFEWIRVSKTNKDIDEANLYKLRECKTLGLAINYEGDYEEVNSVLNIGKRVGVDYVQVRPVLNTKGEITEQSMYGLNHHVTEDPLLIISDYKFEDAQMKHQYDTCEAFHLTPFIWEDGAVTVCGYMKGNPDYHLGNIYDHSFGNIMRSAPDYVAVDDKCQVCCKPHELNKIIHELKNIEDVDFI